MPTHDTILDRVMQEFYCNDCEGFIMIQITASLSNKNVVITCPECGRLHPRKIKNGQIIDDSHSDTAYEICPMPSAYSKNPRTTVCQASARDGAVVTNKNQFMNHNDFLAKAILDESKANKGWFGKLRRNK